MDENANQFLVQTLYANRMSRKPLQKWALLQLTGKTKKWKNTAILSDNYHFLPAGVKTYGAYSPQGIRLIKKIGKKIQEATDEKLSTFLSYVCHPVIC